MLMAVNSNFPLLSWPLQMACAAPRPHGHAGGGGGRKAKGEGEGWGRLGERSEPR